MKRWISLIFIGLALLVMTCKPSTRGPGKNEIQVQVMTNLGEMTFALYPDEAPLSVKNFVEYAESGFYSGTIFHRVIDGFMIQGGGFDTNLNAKETRSPIINEARNGLSNTRGTLAMARTSDIHSATSQFFINLVDNPRLDHQGEAPTQYGYAVFGRVTQGMDLVDHIAKMPTESRNRMDDVPASPVIILSVKIIH